MVLSNKSDPLPVRYTGSKHVKGWASKTRSGEERVLDSSVMKRRDLSLLR